MDIRKSSIHGKGVFATEYIKKDTILTCDILEVTPTEIVREYVFPFIGHRTCLHIGWATFLNSSREPNIRHLGIDHKEMISMFISLRDIQPGEEITLKYLNK